MIQKLMSEQLINQISFEVKEKFLNPPLSCYLSITIRIEVPWILTIVQFLDGIIYSNRDVYIQRKRTVYLSIGRISELY